MKVVFNGNQQQIYERKNKSFQVFYLKKFFGCVKKLKLKTFSLKFWMITGDMIFGLNDTLKIEPFLGLSIKVFVNFVIKLLQKQGKVSININMKRKANGSA